jgi:glycosyltransferase involved in cell wall biosynthesis
MTSPQPILFTHYGANWIRGSERCLLDLLAHLDRERYAPVLWCNASALADAASGLDLPVHLSRFSILFDHAPPRYAVANYLRLVREARRLVRHYGIRLLHSNGGAPTQWLLPVARAARRPLVLHLHAVYSRRDRCLLGLHQASLAVGVSGGCVQGLLDDGMPSSQVRVIHNGVDPAQLARGDERGLRARLGIRLDDTVVVQVGSLIHRKGVDLLLNAFVHLRKEHPSSHLIVAGDGPERISLQRLAHALALDGHVHFLGFVESSGALFRDVADIVVSPSRGEGFGLTVIEAGWFGVPVVATDTPGMREILTDGVNGLVVPVGDVAALTRALRTLARDPVLRARLGDAARRNVQERFTIQRTVAAFEALYAELLARPVQEFGWTGPRVGPAVYARWVRDVAARRLRHFIRNSPATG